MHGFMFTTDVRDVLSKAREEAARLHNDHVDAEHIALAFTRADTSAARVLRDMNVDPDALRETMEHSVRASDAPPPRGDLPYSSRAKKTLEHALDEAAGHGHDFVGVEHLLIGVIRETGGPAADVFTSHGATTDKIRAHLLAGHPENPARMPKPRSERRFFGLF